MSMIIDGVEIRDEIEPETMEALRENVKLWREKNQESLQAGRGPICPVCHGEMYEIEDKITGRKTGHLWKCVCMPPNVVVSIGGFAE